MLAFCIPVEDVDPRGGRNLGKLSRVLVGGEVHLLELRRVGHVGGFRKDDTAVNVGAAATTMQITSEEGTDWRA